VVSVTLEVFTVVLLKIRDVTLCCWVSGWYTYPLKMKALCSFQASGTTHPVTQHYISKDQSPQHCSAVCYACFGSYVSWNNQSYKIFLYDSMDHNVNCGVYSRKKKPLETIYSTFFNWCCFIMCIFANCICLACIVVILCVFVVPYVYLLYRMCICCTLCVFVVPYVYLLYLMCVCCALCVYCCFYFRCRTAG
jgi:hypothetical protein